MLQVLVVGSNDTESSFFVEALQYRFGYSTPNLWLGTSTELVDQDKTAFVAALHHDFHVGKVR